MSVSAVTSVHILMLFLSLKNTFDITIQTLQNRGISFCFRTDELKEFQDFVLINMQMAATWCCKLSPGNCGVLSHTLHHISWWYGKGKHFYLSVGRSGASCGVLVVVHVNGHAAAWVVVALETENTQVPSHWTWWMHSLERTSSGLLQYLMYCGDEYKKVFCVYLQACWDIYILHCVYVCVCVVCQIYKTTLAPVKNGLYRKLGQI